MRWIIPLIFMIFLLFIISYVLSNELGNAPYNWISEYDIEIYNDRIVIHIENASLSRYDDSRSMIPILGEGSNGIRIVPKSEEDIHIGDIVTYEAEWIDGLVVHRVVYIGEDSLGRYFILKGDNNSESDPERVRFDQIRYVTVALIY